MAATFDWGPVIVVGSITLVVLAALGFWALQHRRQRTVAKQAIPAAEFAAAVERTIADLRAEPDPRRAVIAAYAQMEQALGLAGLPRDPSEAPREYLGRVLPQVGAGADSVGRLTSLFERAKFSPHAIDDDDEGRSDRSPRVPPRRPAGSRADPHSRRLSLLAVLASAGLALAIFLRPGGRALALDVYLLTVGGLGAPGRDRADAGPAATRGSDAPRPPAGRPAGSGAAARAGQARARGRSRDRDRLRRPLPPPPDDPERSRPQRLRLRGVDLDAPGGAAEELLGPEAWELARPDHPRPRAHDAAGLPLREDRGRRRRAGAPVTTIAEVAERAQTLLDEVERAVVGKREALELVLLGLLADGHVLIEDFPGLAKTLIARSFAQATSLGFGRIQFTPDLMPSDVTGSSVYNQRTADFEFRPGPDLHQPPPRRRDQPRPAEDAGGAARGDAGAAGDDRGATRACSSARSSCSRPRTRSSTRARTRCPRRSSTASCCGSRSATRRARTSSASSSSAATGARTRSSCARSSTARRCARCSARSRTSTSPRASATTSSTSSARRARAPSVQVGASPRGTLAILKLARARAALDGRDFVVPDDVKAVAAPALAHRLALRPELWVQQVRAEDVVAERLATVPTPPAGRTVTRGASPKAAAYAALGGLGAARRARHRGGPSSPRSRRRSSSCSRAGFLAAGEPDAAYVGTGRPDRVLEGDTVELEVELERRADDRARSRCCSSCRPVVVADGAQPGRGPAEPRATRTLTLPAARRALGRLPLGEV